MEDEAPSVLMVGRGLPDPSVGMFSWGTNGSTVTGLVGVLCSPG